MIIRLATSNDLERLYDFSREAPPGMTSMPNDRQTWQKKLAIADACFDSINDEPESRIFFLVMENNEGKLVGTAGIHTQIGLKRPFYNYRVAKQVTASESLDVTVSCETLNLVNDFTGATELTSLYLKPEARVKPLGQLMSRCRFVLMHDFPQFFGQMVFAEIRGWLNEQETSPFWENIGKKFFTLPYKKADFISAVNGSQFISDLMPRYPIYLNLLPESVQEVVGKAHDEAVPAQRLLEREGFGYRGYVDIFDAGPVVQCEREKVVSIQQCKSMIVSRIEREESLANAAPVVVSNCKQDNYGISLASVKELNDKELVVGAKIADVLSLQEGDPISLLALRRK